MTLNDATGVSFSEVVEFTPGEDIIMTKLEQIEEKLDELIEKVSNLNLSYNEGYSVDG